MKRFLSLLLTAAMLLSLVPFSMFSALAEEAALGSVDNPEEIFLQDNLSYIDVYITENSGGYYFSWTAPSDGTLSVGINSSRTSAGEELGWCYSVNNTTAIYYGDTHFSDDSVVVDTETLDVSEGDVIHICLNTHDPEDMWNSPAGIIGLTLEYTMAIVATDDEAPVDPETSDEESSEESVPDVEVENNIAYGKSYTTSAIYCPNTTTDWSHDPSCAPAYPDENGVTLTDGLLPTNRAYSDAAWVGLHDGISDQEWSYVTIDLEGTYAIDKVVAYVTPDLGDGVSAPYWIGVVGYNGETGIWEEIGQPAIPADDGVSNYIAVECAGNGGVYEKIEVRMLKGAYTFISEVAAYGTASEYPAVEESSEEPVESSEPETSDSESVTGGLEYTLSDDGTYYIVSGYTGSVTEVVIPETYEGLPVKEIGDSAFESCYDLTSIEIPDSVTAIGGYAFFDCFDLRIITMGNSVTFIGDDAFAYCQNLTKIEIPDSVTTIYGNPFRSCNALEVIEVSEGNTVYHSENNCLIETATGILISGCNTSIIPEDGSVTEIGNYAFYDLDIIANITIPDSVTTIGENAFGGCSGLSSVQFGDSVANIGFAAFVDCYCLTNVELPASLTTIGGSAFAYCDGLTSITIPDSVTTISGNPFIGCNALEVIKVSEGNAVYHSKNNCLIETATGILISGCKTSIIPDDGSVTAIGDSAFDNCSGLTSVTIPDSVTTIGASAFSYCNVLTDITIPDSVTAIGDFAFRYCSSLTSITIPESVTEMGYGVFEVCENLTEIYCESSSQPEGWDAYWLGDYCTATIYWNGVAEEPSEEESSEPEVSDDESSEDVSSENVEKLDISNNLAFGKSYTTSMPFRQGGANVSWGYDENCMISYPDETGKTLTDGLISIENGYVGEPWFGLHSDTPDAKELGYAWIEVDLGDVYDITGCGLYVPSDAMKEKYGSNITPDTIIFYGSCDGVNYSTLGTASISNANVCTAVAALALDEVSGVRYVQARITNTGWILVSEIMVLGELMADDSSEPEVSDDESSTPVEESSEPEVSDEESSEEPPVESSEESVPDESSEESVESSEPEVSDEESSEEPPVESSEEPVPDESSEEPVESSEPEVSEDESSSDDTSVPEGGEAVSYSFTIDGIDIPVEDGFVVVNTSLQSWANNNPNWTMSLQCIPSGDGWEVIATCACPADGFDLPTASDMISASGFTDEEGSVYISIHQGSDNSNYNAWALGKGMIVEGALEEGAIITFKAYIFKDDESSEEPPVESSEEPVPEESSEEPVESSEPESSDEESSEAPTEEEPAFSADISVDKTEYAPGEEIVVTVTVNDITAPHGIQTVEMMLYYDTEKVELANPPKEGSVALGAFKSYAEWEDLSIVYTFDNGTTAIALRALTTGGANGTTFTSATEDGQLVFKITFVAKETANGELTFEIPDSEVNASYIDPETYIESKYVGSGSWVTLAEKISETPVESEVPEVSEDPIESSDEESSEPEIPGTPAPEESDDISDEVSEDPSVPDEESSEPDVSDETSEPIEDETILKGDLDGDGYISHIDYVLLKRAYFATYYLSETEFVAADFNSNDELDSLDYIYLKRAYFGVYTAENCAPVYNGENIDFETDTETESPDFDVTLSTPINIGAGSEFTATITVDNITAVNGLQGVSFALVYENEKLELLKNSDTVEVAVMSEYAEWEDFTKTVTLSDGTTALYVSAVTAGTKGAFTNLTADGSLTFEITFEVDELARKTTLSVLSNSVEGFCIDDNGNLVEYIGNGSSVTKTIGVPVILEPFEPEEESSEEPPVESSEEESSEEPVESSEEESEEVIYEVSVETDTEIDIEDNGAFEGGTIVEVVEVIIEEVHEVVTNLFNKILALDFTASKDGEAVQPNGKIKVNIAIPDGFSNNVSVYYVSDDGKMEKINSTVDAENRKVTAEIEHFSTYVLVDNESKVMLGDINGNGEIDSLDYILLKRAYFGTFQLSEEANKSADINGNGEVDSLDYILLKRAYFGTYKINKE